VVDISAIDSKKLKFVGIRKQKLQDFVVKTKDANSDTRYKIAFNNRVIEFLFKLMLIPLNSKCLVYSARYFA